MRRWLHATASAALSLSVASAVLSADREGNALEPLDSFQRSTLVIESRGGRHEFEVWIADSPPRRARGLMFVERLETGTGMLFLYGQPQPISMWMKNTLIPLDMLFVASDGRITRVARDTKPRTLGTISSLGLVTAVIEIGGGEARRLGIEPGDRVLHPAFRPRNG